MSATTVNLLKSSGLLIPQAYLAASDAYKEVTLRQIASTPDEFGLNMIGWGVTGGGVYVPLLVDASGRLQTTPLTSAGAQVTGATDAAAPAGAVLVGGFDGTNLRGLRAGYGGAGNPAVGMLNVMPVVRRASDGTISTLAAAISAADADTGVAFGSASPMLWNDASFDRQRSNTEGTLLASAARTATAESAVQTNYNARGVTANIDVTAKAAATTLTVNLLVKDANGDYVVFASSSAFAAAAGTTYSVTFHPGVLAADFATNHEGKSVPVPRSYKVQVVPSDANSVTYAASQAQEV